MKFEELREGMELKVPEPDLCPVVRSQIVTVSEVDNQNRTVLLTWVADHEPNSLRVTSAAFAGMRVMDVFTPSLPRELTKAEVRKMAREEAADVVAEVFAKVVRQSLEEMEAYASVDLDSKKHEPEARAYKRASRSASDFLSGLKAAQDVREGL